jgi:invasion protein IalB
VQIGKEEPIKLKFTTCDASGCFAETTITDATIENLKNGQEVSYSGIDAQGGSILVPVALAGFKAAFDGNPMPMETYNTEMKRIAETIVVRAARRRKEQHP